MLNSGVVWLQHGGSDAARVGLAYISEWPVQEMSRGEPDVPLSTFRKLCHKVTAIAADMDAVSLGQTFLRGRHSMLAYKYGCRLQHCKDNRLKLQNDSCLRISSLPACRSCSWLMLES